MKVRFDGTVSLCRKVWSPRELRFENTRPVAVLLFPPGSVVRPAVVGVGDHAAMIGNRPRGVPIPVVPVISIITVIAIVTGITKNKTKRGTIKIWIPVIRVVIRIVGGWVV